MNYGRGPPLSPCKNYINEIVSRRYLKQVSLRKNFKSQNLNICKVFQEHYRRNGLKIIIHFGEGAYTTTTAQLTLLLERGLEKIKW